MEKAKRCPQCGETKALDLFNRNRAQADGLQTRCRKCEHGVDQRMCIEPGCESVVTGYQRRCDEHQAEIEAGQSARKERARQLREATGAKKAAAEAQRTADEEIRQTRRCAECDGPVPESKPLFARYCSDPCRDAVNKRRQHEQYEASTAQLRARSCVDCGADMTKRGGAHPAATRCENCQARHRATRKRARKSRAAERSCSGCGKSLRGYAKGKTQCGYCERGPKWCIGCGQVDVRGQRGLRCEECQAARDAHAASAEAKAERSAHMREWQKSNPLKVQLWDRRRWAGKYDVPFEITLADIEEIWPDDNRCPVCQVTLTREHAHTANGSIDRIDNRHERGYVKGNVHIVCVGCNGKKRDLSVAELAEDAAGEHWRAWAVGYLAENSGPRRRVVRRKAA